MAITHRNHFKCAPSSSVYSHCGATNLQKSFDLAELKLYTHWAVFPPPPAFGKHHPTFCFCVFDYFS